MSPTRPFILASLLLVGCWSHPLSAAESTPPAGERIAPERLELTVIKVYAASDGEARFRAYVVKWKDQEVIVSDSLARTNYKEGDIISVLAMNHPVPRGQESHRLLAFTVVPPPPSGR